MFKLPSSSEQFKDTQDQSTEANLYTGGGPFSVMASPSNRQGSGGMYDASIGVIGDNGPSMSRSASSIFTGYSLGGDPDIFGQHNAVIGANSSNYDHEKETDKLKTPQTDAKFIWSTPSVNSSSGQGGNGGSFSNDFIFSHSPILSSHSVFNRPSQAFSSGPFTPAVGNFGTSAGFATPTPASAGNGFGTPSGLPEANGYGTPGLATPTEFSQRSNKVETLIRNLDQAVLALKAEIRNLGNENKLVSDEVKVLKAENERLRSANTFQNDSGQYGDLRFRHDSNTTQQSKEIPESASQIQSGKEFILPTPPSELILGGSQSEYSTSGRVSPAGKKERQLPYSKTPSQPATYAVGRSTIEFKPDLRSESGYYEAVVYGLEKNIPMAHIKEEIEKDNRFELACLPRPLIRSPTTGGASSTLETNNNSTVHSIVISFADQQNMALAIANSVVIDQVSRRVKALRKSKRRTSSQQLQQVGDWKKKESNTSGNTSRRDSNEREEYGDEDEQ